ncbi:MAG: epoxyqueuosine reductase, partial [Chloroflexota bacterium]
MTATLPQTKSPADMAGFITAEVKSFVANSPLNRMPTPEKDIIFDEPLVQFADGDDPLFTEYKAIIATTHLTPREALARAGDKKPDELPRRISVISWILPITLNTRKSNRTQTRHPSRLWSHTRWFGEKLNEALRAHVMALLTARGYLAAAPGLPPLLKIERNEKGMYSNWSERHIAYAAGLGTFSLSDGFITERGIAHRTGSVVTSLELPASPRTAAGTYANCLFYAGEKCVACIKRCPAGAITEAGHDKNKCQQYMH